jgi:hypothetical protein
MTIYAYADDTNKLRSIQLDVSYALRELRMVEYPIESTWTIPSKNQIEIYRDRSSRLDVRTRSQLVQRAVLQEIITRYHLQEFKIITGPEQSDTLELKRDKRGRLDDNTMQKLRSLHPSILDLIFVKYSEEAALII